MKRIEASALYNLELKWIQQARDMRASGEQPRAGQLTDRATVLETCANELERVLNRYRPCPSEV